MAIPALDKHAVSVVNEERLAIHRLELCVARYRTCDTKRWLFVDVYVLWKEQHGLA